MNPLSIVGAAIGLVLLSVLALVVLGSILAFIGILLGVAHAIVTAL